MAKFITLISNVTVGFGLLVALAAFLPFIASVRYVVGFEILNAVIAATALGYGTAYARVAYGILRMPPKMLSAAQLYSVAAVVCCAGIVLSFGGLWVWRFLEKPPGFEDHPLWMFGRWMTAIGFILALATTRSDDGLVPTSAYLRTIFIVTTVTIVTVVIITIIGIPPKKAFGL